MKNLMKIIILVFRHTDGKIKSEKKENVEQRMKMCDKSCHN